MNKKPKGASKRPIHGRRAEHINTLPPDPEQGNDGRADKANVVIQTFRRVTGTDIEDALGDLLASLMHLCDRDPRLGSFYPQLHRAQRHYLEETADDDSYARLF